jgi:predicted kinase
VTDPFRWRLSWWLAEQIAQRPDPVLASTIYDDPEVKTRDEDDDLQEAIFDPFRHPRDRVGQFARGFGSRRGMRSPGLTDDDMGDVDMGATLAKGDTAKDLLGDAVDTTELFREGDREIPSEYRYTKDRLEQVHEPIVEGTLGDHQEQEEPHILVLAGGPASGKTTLLRQRAEIRPDDAVHIDADAVKGGTAEHKGIPEYVDMLEQGDYYAAFGTHRESGDIAKKILDKAMEGKRNIILDCTGDQDPGVFAKELTELTKRGYKVDVLYVSTPTDTASKFNLIRAEEEKRFVPTNVLRELHRRVGVNFRDEIQHLEGLNSVRVFDRKTGGMIAAQKEGKMTVFDEDAYKQWLAKADEKEQKLPTKKIDEAKSEPPEPKWRGSIEIPFDLDDFTRSRD